ncbi:GNAT family N-acetyltransferase, partial [Acinetobacter baumannii]
SAMMRALRDVAVERGAMAIALSVAMDNSRAAALYRRCGYVEVPGDDPVAPYRAMRLSLA